MTTSYRTIPAPQQGQYNDKGSRFLAFAYPVQSEQDVKEHIALLRKEHVKSRHVCYAFRTGTGNALERSNDDGEPSGTAGKPILGQIHSLSLTNVMVAVVRYFGGTLLGVSGLINAYKSAAQDALGNAGIIERHIQAIFEIETDYLRMHEVMNYLKREGIDVISLQMQHTCILMVALHPELTEKLTMDMKGKFGIMVNFKHYA